MDLGIAGQTALVTGASRGIGFAVARRFALEGCNVHLASRSGPDLEAARAKILQEAKVKVTCHAHDLAQDASVNQLAAECGDVDVLVNNAGERPAASYIAGTAGNAALMAFSRALGGESVDYGVRVLGVNPGSTETERARKRIEKLAQDKFGDASRWRELTTDAPFGRLATSDELADVIVFMASARASYVSGTIVTVDGGRTVRNRTV